MLKHYSSHKEIVRKYRDVLYYLHPILRDIPKKTQLHGGGSVIRNEGRDLDLPLSSMREAVDFSAEDVLYYKICNACGTLHLLVDAVCSGMVGVVGETMNAVTEHTGQTFSASGEVMAIENILKGLEGVEIHFDSKGNPRTPNIVILPDTSIPLDKIKEQFPEAVPRIQEIIERKRKEFHDKKGFRKLSRIS